MKLCRSALALLLATAASSLLDGAEAANSLSSFQASDPTAIKNLLAKSNRLPKRRLGDEEQAEEEEEEDEFGFMMNYAVKLLSCEAGMPFAGYDQDGNQNEKEYSSVVYRLCPLASDEGCDGTTGTDGCSSGYGDYVVGINTYVDAYAETMRDRRRRLADDFNLAEYAECKEVEFQEQEQEQEQDDAEDEGDEGEDEGEQEEGEGEEGEDRRRRLEDEGEDEAEDDYEVQYYVGPACSADGTDVILDLFTEYTCQTAAASGTYESLSYGASLPYSSGGLGFACMSCSQDNDGDGNYETAEYCKKLYEFSGRCETNMEIYSSYYGKDEGECEYIAQLTEIAAQNSSNSTGGGASAGKIIGWIILALVVVGGIAYCIMQKKRRTTGVSEEALVGEHADRIA